MTDHDTTNGGAPGGPADVSVSEKLDTVAGAVAQIARSHTDLLAHVAEAEARRAEMASAAAEQMVALQQLVAQQRDDLALALDVLARMADALERAEARTDDRLAAVRDAATGPVVDLQEMLAARGERTDRRLEAMAASLAALEERPAATPATADVDLTPVHEHLDRLTRSVDDLTGQLPELGEALAELRAAEAEPAPPPPDRRDVAEEITDHVDTALAGTLRLIDTRLNSLREVITERRADEGSNGRQAAGFEAGAVMGAAQAAWNRLEQRLDHEFDDLGRQLQAMAALIEQAVSTAEAAEAAASRPVVTGDQLRKAATSVKDTVLGASRSRRERRGGPRSLGPGPGPGPDSTASGGR